MDAGEAPGSGARREGGRPDRPHRRRPAAGRVSGHLRPDQRARPAVQELRVLPRGLLVRPPLRGRGGALPGDGQEDAAHGRDADGRRLRPRVRARQEGLHPRPRRHRAGARQAVARHRREALLRAGEGDAGPPRPEAVDLRGPVQAARRQPHGRLPRQAAPHRRVVRALLPEGPEALRHPLRAGPRAGARAEGSGRPRRARDVPLLRDGRRGRTRRATRACGPPRRRCTTA